ncbi:MAG: ferritin [Candidatus Margulisbacteria bacterium]|nr:ferritin [Candidatus Margulisiibacteriota bacterium]
MNKQLEKALYQQLNREYFSAYQYLAMSAYFEHQSFKGFASWMRRQSDEEMEHMMKYYTYIIDRDGEMAFESIAKPIQKFSSPLSVFQAGLKQEKEITKHIHNLIELAISKKDHATHHFLQWFITEQVEEESSFKDIVHQLSLIGTNKAGLLMLDKKLGESASRES